MHNSEKIRPLVSVLVVTYQQKAYIRQTLDSILMQRCRFPFEILLGDDASTDGTAEICKEYADKYPEIIRLYLRKSNLGFLNNYFDLFQQARGTYLADCGGDDYWLDETRLQQQVDFLESHPETGIISGNWQIQDESTGNTTVATTLPEAGWWHPSLMGKEAVVAYIQEERIPKVLLSAACFRASWAKEAFYNNPDLFKGSEATCEDLPLIICLLMKGNLCIRPDFWAVYRKRSSSISHSEHSEDWITDFAFKTFRQTLLIAEHAGLEPQELNGYARKLSNDFALHAFVQKNVDFYKLLKDTMRRFNYRTSRKFNLYGWYMKHPGRGNWLRKSQILRHEHLKP